MLVPMSWLREFVPYEGTTQALGDKLTMAGLELEGILHPFDYLAEIKVGFVAQCLPHPNSDHLHCCKVDIGSGDLLDIVCGAPNVAAGQKVAVAPVGSRLPDGTVIKKSKLRGQLSLGMICSERELGLSDDHSGIMVLPESTDIGHSLLNALDLERDVLDLSITPNRGDCLSILGIARECALGFKLPMHLPELPLILDPRIENPAVECSIEDPDLCWLYSGRVVRDVALGPSPLRMRCRLIAVGARPISNIVDITNYILFECGQPLHAFDLDKLEGCRIIVRKANNGQKFTTLDGKERVLTDADLCICDSKRAIALAGVMGGLDSEITDHTKNIFLESAVFQPKTIRKTARRLGINSEASYRFERGIDQRRSIWAMDRACSLLASICGGIPSEKLSCVEPRPFIPAQISYRPSRANLILGINISNKVQSESLSADGCGVAEIEEDKWQIGQPSWRHDLTREADLIEEVGRIYGIDSIPPALPCVTRNFEDNLADQTEFAFIQHIKHWAAGTGLNEVINYSFVGQSELDQLNLPKEPRIALSNPLSEELNVLRTCIAPGLLNDLNNNLAFGLQSIRLFEVASVFTLDAASETTARETPCLGMLLNGFRHVHGWPRDEELLGYGDLKGLLENLFDFLNIADFETRLLAQHEFLSPAIEIKLKNKIAGIAGCLNGELAKNLHTQKPVWLAELNLAVLRKLHLESKIKYKPLPVYPAIVRDMTVIVPEQMHTGDVIKKILARKTPLLESVNLIDFFEPLDRHEKNLTFRLVFRHGSRTLKDSEIDKEREKIADWLRNELNAKI